MENIIHSQIGLFHTILAVAAMISGTLILFKKKGTKTHKKTGYLYILSMILMNISSFFIYNFGGFSLFHSFAIFSLITIIAAIIPTFLRTKNWLHYHFYFLNWSVVGLYCAFVAEVGTRFTNGNSSFMTAIFISMVVPSIIGAYFINKNAKKHNLK